MLPALGAVDSKLLAPPNGLEGLPHAPPSTESESTEALASASSRPRVPLDAVEEECLPVCLRIGAFRFGETSRRPGPDCKARAAAQAAGIVEDGQEMPLGFERRRCQRAACPTREDCRRLS